MTVDLYQTPLRYGEAYDELSADGINPRPHWAHLMESLRSIGPEELGRRCSRAERRIRENGITYNIYSDPLGANRPWEIDIVPFLIPADEWRYIEQGIIQRAKLLSLILEDIYGSQLLLKNGRLPAELVYANPAFLRPLVGVRVPSHSYLHMLAVDLPVRVDLDRTVVGVVAADDDAAAVTDHVERLRDGIGAATRFDDDIHAATARRRVNGVEPILTRHLEAKGVRRSHAAREGEAVIRCADSDHVTRTGERGEDAI